MTTPSNDRYQYGYLTVTPIEGMDPRDGQGISFFDDARGRHEMRRYATLLILLDEFGEQGWLFSDPEERDTVDVVGEDAASLSGYPKATASKTSTVWFAKRVARH